MSLVFATIVTILCPLPWWNDILSPGYQHEVRGPGLLSAGCTCKVWIWDCRVQSPGMYLWSSESGFAECRVWSPESGIAEYGILRFTLEVRMYHSTIIFQSPKSGVAGCRVWRSIHELRMHLSSIYHNGQRYSRFLFVLFPCMQLHTLLPRQKQGRPWDLKSCFKCWRKWCCTKLARKHRFQIYLASLFDKTYVALQGL